MKHINMINLSNMRDLDFPRYFLRVLQVNLIVTGVVA